MRVLLLGSGGREHALAWKLSTSKQLSKLYIAPGNPGTAIHGENVPLDILSPQAVAAYCQQQAIDLLVVGPEGPLVAGVADVCRAAGIAVVGPSQAAAQLEGSKAYSKAFMQQHGIPTARYRVFRPSELNLAAGYIQDHPLPVVIKASGLAAGKGVVIAQDRDTARQTLQEMLVDQIFGEAGDEVVVEEFLDGIEVSVFALCDGQSYVLLPEAKDYKRVGEGDTGPNTGGMGSVSPVHFADDAFIQKVEQRIIQPTLAGMQAAGTPYQGFLFAGIMNVRGEPYLLEYNCRLGDPETQSVLPRIAEDLLPWLLAAAQGQLPRTEMVFKHRHAVSIVCVAGGYPGKYQTGDEITGLNYLKDVQVFHAGTKMQGGKLVTAGGRVLAVMAKGESLAQAAAQARAAAAQLEFRGKHYRHDIGHDLMMEA